MTTTRRFALGTGLAMIILTQGFSCSTASISGAELSRTTKDNVAVDPTTAFKTTDHELHCAATLSSAPDDTKVRARWIAVKAGDIPANTKIIENVIEAKGANHLDFKLTVEKDLPAGDYKVELALNPEEGKDQPATKTIDFKVAAE
ncbi:MAG: hypothetical protein JWM80_3039 [Cyanobacteria bacterium RYN_339]|nr:hypothetical protein [Cyanobacteria bacterium RYN_339]